MHVCSAFTVRISVFATCRRLLLLFCESAMALIQFVLCVHAIAELLPCMNCLICGSFRLEVGSS